MRGWRALCALAAVLCLGQRAVGARVDLSADAAFQSLFTTSATARHARSTVLEYDLKDGIVSLLAEPAATSKYASKLYQFAADASVGEVLASTVVRGVLRRSSLQAKQRCSMRSGDNEVDLASSLSTVLLANAEGVTLECPVSIDQDATTSRLAQAAAQHQAVATYSFRTFPSLYPSVLADDAEIKQQMEELGKVVNSAAKSNKAAAPAMVAAPAEDESSLLAQHSSVSASVEAEAKSEVRATELATPQIAALYPTQGVDYHSYLQWASEAAEAQQILGSIREYPTWRGLSGRFDATTGTLLKRGEKPAPSSTPVRMVLTADWASGTVESDYVGQLMAWEKDRPDWTLNAGDVYWTGTPTNVRQTCLGEPKNNLPGQRGVRWPKGKLGSFAVLGNHEMYNRGDAFFDLWMPTLGTKKVRQFAGYAALETANWRVLMLDTGFGSYDKWGTNQPADRTDMPAALYDWLLTEVLLSDPSDKRGILVITHHQPNTAFEEPFMLPAQGLAARLPPGRKFYWLFGHEHKLSFYDLSTLRAVQGHTVSYIGRCIGNGGFPTNLVPLASTPKPAGSGRLLGYDSRVYQTLFEKVDPKPELGDDGLRKTFNGWVDLTFTGPDVAVSYRSLKLEGKYATNAASAEFAKETLTVDADGNVQFKEPLTFTALVTRVGGVSASKPKPAPTVSAAAPAAAAAGAVAGAVKPTAPVPQSCKASGVVGSCMLASSCKGKVYSNLCPGTPANIKCCVPKTAAKTKTATKPKTKATTTVAKKPKVPAKKKPTAVAPKKKTPAAAPKKSTTVKSTGVKCTTAQGLVGKCMAKSSCSGESVVGLCPGAANIQCCIAKTATARFMQMKDEVHQQALEPAQS